MPKNWIAFATGPNGGPSSSMSMNSGLVATQKEAEAWAAKTMGSRTAVEGIVIAKIHSKAQRVVSPIEFVGVSDIAEVEQPKPEAEAA